MNKYAYDFAGAEARVKNQPFWDYYGRVTEVIGLTIEVAGVRASMGELCIIGAGPTSIEAEVVGFSEDNLYLFPYSPTQGIAPGSRVRPLRRKTTVRVGPGLLGAIVDGLGRPMEGYELKGGSDEYPLDQAPPSPLERERIDHILHTGVKSIDLFLTAGRGQRLGIFAGSGVGKSTLLGMISRGSDADINVIALVGERGREVKDFLEKDLGAEGLKRSIVVVATSDQPALMRIKAALTATAIAEYFRDQGKKVMLLMDSVTRFATAQREVGLAIGEPPTTRGFTPSVFAMLPKLLERSGTSRHGSITALYTVLVDGDDMNEPIADAVRGILDGHIVLSRRLAEQNFYPAIDILQSVSRLANELVPAEQRQLVSEARNLLATYRQNEDLINIGAYVRGSNDLVDRALDKVPSINDLLSQDVGERAILSEGLTKLKSILAR